MARHAPWFDAVEIDTRPKLWQIGAVLRLRRFLRGGGFTRVYDLQTSDRSGFYFRLMGGAGSGVEWNGIAAGCSHPHANPRRDFLHTQDRQAEQLRCAGITTLPPADLTWMRAEADLSRLSLPERFVLLAPGGAPHRPEKRWPAAHYGALACALAAQGETPMVLGTAAEAEEIATICAACPKALSLLGQTTLFDLAALAQRAAGAVGNDTGPLHIIAAAGCPTVALYSHASDPALCAQRGPRVAVLRHQRLDELSVSQALNALTALRA